jgi:hypothetical protein
MQEAIFSQQVNGVIVLDSANLHVIKVWGTAEERAFAYGYLLGAETAEMFVDYVKPVFIGGHYEEMRGIILDEVDVSFDTVFIQEAKAFINGYHAANNVITDSIDYVDLLIGNSIQDLIALTSGKSLFNCSSLISWGESTMTTDLEGKSVVSHMFDLPHNETLRKSHVVVVNFPTEPGTQEWLLSHLAGSLVPIDGFNRHTGVFGQAMSDYTGQFYHGKSYLPYGYALRKALEKADYNNDGNQDVMDIKEALDDQQDGFACGGFTAAISETQPNDSLTALIAEWAPENPTHVYRFNSFPDSIPADNLYTANSQIARNNSYNFCNRYNNIRNQIGSGYGMSLEESWELMRNYSILTNNIQFKQFAPEADIFKLAVRTSANIPAYMTEPYVFSLNDLFTHPLYNGNEEEKESSKNGFTIYILPNPASENATIQFLLQKPCLVRVALHDCVGKQVLTINEGFRPTGINRIRCDLNGLPAGIYIVRMYAGNEATIDRLIKY